MTMHTDHDHSRQASAASPPDAMVTPIAASPSGQVLFAGGGADLDTALDSAELYDPGLDFADARRPTLDAQPATITLPAALDLAGMGFRASTQAPTGAIVGTEGSGGGTTSNSPTNYPLVQFERLDNQQQFFVRSDPAQPWTDTTFASVELQPFDPLTQSGLPDGQYRVTVFINSIPSQTVLVAFKSNQISDRIFADGFDGTP